MTAGSVTTADLRRVVAALAAPGSLARAGDDAERIEQIALLERLRSVTAAVQAEVAVRFAASQRAAQTEAGVPAERRERGIAAQVGLARRVSPWAAARWLGNARIMIGELPQTFAVLRAGATSEWRATLIARETAVLSREHRGEVDRHLAPRLAGPHGLGDQRVAAEARALGYRLDPHAAVNRARTADSDRRVSVRPAPDTMCWLGTLVPVAAGVSAYATLRRDADTLVGTGQAGTNRDGSNRTRTQVMADLLVERVTGRASAGDVPVEIELLISDTTLLDEHADRADEPAQLVGYGPVPATIARELALGHPDATAPRWLRRLYTDRGRLVALDSRRRLFTTAQRRYLRLRDRTCRTPYCDAPIRHADHVVPHADGGPTTLHNAAGDCAACNHAKQAAGWHARTDHSGTLTITTPTGHTYRSEPPPPPGTSPPGTSPPGTSPPSRQRDAVLADRGWRVMRLRAS